MVGFACEGPLPSLIAIQLSDGLSTQTTTLYHLCQSILVQENANTWSTLAGNGFFSEEYTKKPKIF